MNEAELREELIAARSAYRTSMANYSCYRWREHEDAVDRYEDARRNLRNHLRANGHPKAAVTH